MNEIRALTILLFAAGIASLATPLVMRFALAVGAVDRPNERKVSRREQMPLLGGLAVGLGCGASLLLSTLWAGGPPIWPKAAGFAIGAVLLTGVGFVDDRFTIRASVKFAFQVAAALIAIQAGFRFDLFSDPLTLQTLDVPIWIMLPVSVVWIVGVTNAMNLIDGLDGLSSGLGAIIAATLTIICWQAEQWVGVVIGLSLCGALIGYLPYNFPPARIFLGDTGSLLIGFALSVLALEGYRKAAFLAFVVPILALAIPLLDTLLSIVRRVRSGRSMFSPDKLHMHHRLLVREGSHRSAVLMLYFLTSCFCMIAISFAQIDGWLAFVYLAAVVAVTIRLLRNLDAFSLDVPSAPPRDATEQSPPAVVGNEGEEKS